MAIFIAGAVRAREGTVEDVRFADLNRDELPNVIVMTRSAGTGAYLSADAFQLRGTDLTLPVSVTGVGGGC
jgi:hypothetical protein